MYQDNQLLYLEKFIQQIVIYPTQNSFDLKNNLKNYFHKKLLNNGVLQSIHSYIEKDLSYETR